MYIVDSGFVLPQYINTPWTNYVVSELKNVVELVDCIDKFNTWRYVCNVVYQSMVKYHTIYFCDWRETLKPEYYLVYTIVPVDCGETWFKKLTIYVRYVKEHHKSRKVLLLCVDTSYWSVSTLKLVLTLRASNLHCLFNKWIHFTNTFTLFPPLNHMSTLLISFLL